MLREHLTSGPEASALVTRGPHARSSLRGLIVSIVRKRATLKPLVGLYMASPQIGSLDSPIKPIIIRPSPKPRQTKHPQKIISQLLVWGLIPTQGEYVENK